ncbi:Transient receptor putative cation channel sub V member 5 [Podochytrium sp. JEL0797]|nr:Transient receptor putative cation channel sub V member 5 [Podochytrium sp. JEL0797]
MIADTSAEPFLPALDKADEAEGDLSVRDDLPAAAVDQSLLFRLDPMWRSVYAGDLAKTKTEALRIVSTLPGTLPRAYERGGEGETILHIAVLMGHVDIVVWILERFPDLANEIYTSDTYCGETALHVAVMKAKTNGDELVRILINAGANVNADPVTGIVFFKDEHKGGLYYGQTILQFAAAVQEENIVRLLLDAGACMDAVDFYGNNILHVLAYLGNFSVAFFQELRATNLRQIEAGVIGINGTIVANLMKARNKDGMTPFQVGIARGQRQIIDCIKDVQWTFGDACEYNVQLEDIDSIQPVVEESKCIDTEHGAQISALEMAVQAKHKHILDHPLFFTLIQAKWLHYGRRFFLFRLLGAATLITLFTIAVSLQPTTIAARASYKSLDARLIFEMLSLMGAAIFTRFNSKSLVFKNGHVFHSDETAIPWLFSIPILATGGIRILTAGTSILTASSAIGDALLYVENILLGFSAVLGWLNMLYYSNGFQNIGPLVLIFRRVLFVDLANWFLLYSLFTAGFAGAFNLQMKSAHSKDPDILDWQTYHGAVVWTVRFVFGDGNYDDFRASQFPVFTMLLFFVYGFLVLVLLVNIFIAKLSLTFTEVSEDSTRLWKLQFASLMLDIDSRLDATMRSKIASQLGFRDATFQNKTPHPSDRRFVFTERLQPSSTGDGVSTPTTLMITIGRDARTGKPIHMVPDRETWSGFWMDVVHSWPLEAFHPFVLYESWPKRAVREEEEGDGVAEVMVCAKVVRQEQHEGEMRKMGVKWARFREREKGFRGEVGEEGSLIRE